MPMSDFEGRAIALTGAGSGIGRALAYALAQRGAKLALADKDEAGLAETARMLGNRPHMVRAFDVRDETALKAWIDDAAREYGSLYGIINNAGLSVVAPFDSTEKEDFDLVMDVNFGAVVHGCRHALPHIRKSDRGLIVNISSVFGMMAYPTQSAYNASKYAVRGLTEAMYLELGETDPQIQVVRVHPGGVKTNVARNAKMVRTMDGAANALDSADEFERNAPTTPEEAAEIILKGIERGRHRILIGPDARMIDILTRLFPVTYFKRIGRFLGKRD